MWHRDRYRSPASRAFVEIAAATVCAAGLAGEPRDDRRRPATRAEPWRPADRIGAPESGGRPAGILPRRARQPVASRSDHASNPPDKLDRRRRRRHRRRRPDDDPGPRSRSSSRSPSCGCSRPSVRRPDGRTSAARELHRRAGDAGGVRGRRHRAVPRRRRDLEGARAGGGAAAARASSTTRAPGAWTRTCRSSCARSTRTTSSGTRGSSPTPTARRCSCVPPLMALRDAVGIERVVVDTYQSVGRHRPQGDRRARGAGQGARRGPAQGRQRLPAPDRVQRPAAHRRVPRQRVHEGGVEGRHREPQDPAPARPARLVHGRPRAGVRQPLRGGPRRDPRPDHAGRGARAVRRASRASWSRTTRPNNVYPLATEAAGTDEVYVGPRPPGPVDRRQPRARVLGRVRQPAQGRGVERGGAGRGARRARLDPQGERAAGGGGAAGPTA